MLRKLIPLALITGLLSPMLLAGDPPWLARSRSGMVASDSPEASQIGADVLRAGGNAFDAAIATSFALAVARPQSTGLGGGGFMVACLAKEKRVVALDFREVAPAGATRARYDRLAAEAGDGPSPTIYGGDAIGVPGQLAGLAEIHKRFATRPLRDLVQPALRLAETGFVADEHYRGAVKEALADFAKWPQFKERYKHIYETLLGNGTAPQDGDKVTRPELAKALRLIAAQGPDAFYKGPLGEAAVKAAQGAGGVLTMDDLAAYSIRERSPLRVTWVRYPAQEEFEIVTMPPPSSGGTCIAETLNVMAAMSKMLRDPGHATRMELTPQESNAPVLVFALKHAFADRARWLGDPDYTQVPVGCLTNPKYAEQLADRLPRGSEDYGSTTLPEDRGTSHFCVADQDGNVVALTETINGVFGSLVIAEPYGIILNNQMDDFAANPGKPNLYGLIQGEANAVAPGKRPLSSMSPTIVFKAGRPVLTLGASGGPRIITSVLQVMLNVIEFDLPLDEAMSAVRVHHQWLPDEVYFDREPPATLVATLKGTNKISSERKTGVVQAIQFLPDGTLVGACDPRKGGRPAGL
jgi:gamma-glutamyltranspeptidase/glutathione hydrolase